MLTRRLLQPLKTANIRFFPRHFLCAPDWIILGVNNACNLRCKMCDVGTGHKESNFYFNMAGARPLNMPRDLIFKIIDETARYFPKAKLCYSFAEPLIYPHLIESIRYAKQKRLTTALTTNAFQLKQMAADLALAGLGEVTVSVDGPPEIHNAIRGHERSFDGAFDGIKKMFEVKGRRPAVSVFCAVTEWNIGHLVRFADLFKSFPLSRLGFLHTNFTPPEVAAAHNALYGRHYPATISNMKEINIERMDLDVLWREIKTLEEQSFPFPVIFSPKIRDFQALRDFYLKPGNFVGTRCHDAFRLLMIKSDGSAMPAHSRCYKINAGNIHQQSLKDIWRSEATARFRKTLAEAGGLLPACARCCSAFSN